MCSASENPHPGQVEEFTSFLTNDSKNKVTVSVRKYETNEWMGEITPKVILYRQEFPKDYKTKIKTIPGKIYEFRFRDHAQDRILSIT